MSTRIRLEGMEFGDIEVLKYVGNKQYETVCKLCGEHKILYGTNIKKGVGVRCSAKQEVSDIANKQFGELTAIKYVGNKKWLCECSCGNRKVIRKANLINGSTQTCGHNINYYGDLTGKQFGEWKVIGKKGYLWECECSCGKISLCNSSDLVQGKTRSCGHNTNVTIDLTGKHFGEWEVLEREGYGKWKCRCSCGTIRSIKAADLKSGATTSCGCMKSQKIKKALYEIYGEISPNKVNSPRTYQQIQAISSKEKLKEFIESYDTTLTSIELAAELGLQLHRVLTLVHSYGLEDKIIINPHESSVEKGVVDYVRSIYNDNVITRDRDLLNGKELDIYIPDKKLAIEVNGTYWHSNIYKHRKYHQDKSIECAKLGIRLIHIFEYEWNTSDTQRKLKNLLKSSLTQSGNIIYARDKKLELKEITQQEAYKFENEYHLQNKANSSINIGLFLDNELLSLMAFDTPRFNSESQYELIRLCTKDNYIIVGGANKMFKYFVHTYKPDSVVSYCNISKFTGRVYTSLGFKSSKEDLTEPNYKWVNPYTKDVKSRYQTQKHKLIAKGLGTPDQTEDEIMENLGYLKIYDSGNLKFNWNKKGV